MSNASLKARLADGANSRSPANALCREAYDYVELLEARMDKCKNYLIDQTDGDSPCDSTLAIAIRILEGRPV